MDFRKPNLKVKHKIMNAKLKLVISKIVWREKNNKKLFFP